MRRPNKLELKLLRLISKGHTEEEIGRLLGISPITVAVRRRSVCRKLDARDTKAAIKTAQRAGLI